MIVNVRVGGSLCEGVKIAVEPSQVNAPSTAGSMWKRDSTVAVLTGSLNSMSIAVRVWAWCGVAAGALRVISLMAGGLRSTAVAL